MTTKPAPTPDASARIDERIAELADWRGEALARLRALILAADPAITEEWKWNVPVWSQGGIVCTGESYKTAVKLTFAKGASVPDPAKLFNASLDGNTRRAIDVREGESLDEKAFKALIVAAVRVNQSKAVPAKVTAKTPAKAKPAAKPAAKTAVKAPAKAPAKKSTKSPN